VVKGTQFRVSVNATSTSVDVMRGQVEVSDFKSGQIAQVMPGQRATTFDHGKPGLSLSGSGTFNPIEQGKPRPSAVDRVPVPKGGLSPLRNAAGGQPIHAHGVQGQLRISSALGDLKLDIHKVTHGLARSSTAVDVVSRSGANSPANNTIWSSSSNASAAATTSVSSATSTAAVSTLSSPSPVAASTVASADTGPGPGKDVGKGNGKGNGANGGGPAGPGKGPPGKGVGSLGLGPPGQGNGPPGGRGPPGHGKP
jgi:hypothetical protein